MIRWGGGGRTIQPIYFIFLGTLVCKHSSKREVTEITQFENRSNQFSRFRPTLFMLPKLTFKFTSVIHKLIFEFVLKFMYEYFYSLRICLSSNFILLVGYVVISRRIRPNVMIKQPNTMNIN